MKKEMSYSHELLDRLIRSEKLYLFRGQEEFEWSLESSWLRGQVKNLSDNNKTTIN